MDKVNRILTPDQILPDGLRGRSQLHGSAVSRLRKLDQAGVTTLGIFDYFVRKDPGTVFARCQLAKACVLDHELTVY